MNFNKKIFISNKEISETSPVFIIAEAGVNHNGDIKIAKKLINIAVDAKADAIKFQAFKTDNLVLKSVSKAPYQLKNGDIHKNQYEMLKQLEITKEQNQGLIEYCKKKNIIFLTTPFDEMSLEELEELNLPAYKIASTDITNLLFLKKIAGTGKPMILSTGMSYLSEVNLALQEIYPYNKNVILLQCTANYPIKNEETNLKVINTYRDNFDILLGFSDHSVGVGASPYAVAMGAKVVEKHFTVNKSSKGPDHKASLSPPELTEYVQKIRETEQYLGTEIKSPTFDEIKTRQALQKFLVAAKPIKKGEIFSEENIIAKRTGGIGISPVYYKDLLKKNAKKDYQIDDIIDE